jgi:hypothetical protein
MYNGNNAMTEQFLIAVQKRHYEKIFFVGKESSRNTAEAKAELMYIEELHHMVAVIEVDGHALKEDRYNVVFKLERNCKCEGLQRQFNFLLGSSTLMCPKCRLNYGKPVIVNKLEESPCLT